MLMAREAACQNGAVDRFTHAILDRDPPRIAERGLGLFDVQNIALLASWPKITDERDCYARFMSKWIQN